MKPPFLSPVGKPYPWVTVGSESVQVEDLISETTTTLRCRCCGTERQAVTRLERTMGPHIFETMSEGEITEYIRRSHEDQD